MGVEGGKVETSMPCLGFEPGSNRAIVLEALTTTPYERPIYFILFLAITFHGLKKHVAYFSVVEK